MATYTPMIEQYLAVKADYQDAFVFYRLGDFYEMFFDDALKASRELEITLTSRQGGTENPIPMCGVPHHSAQGYIETLVARGFKVAICEQVEDPKLTKGIVRREVVQLITPGTVMEGKSLFEKENNYIASISQFSPQVFGFAYVDLSTGEQKVSIVADGFHTVLNLISMLGTKEVVVAVDFDETLCKQCIDRGVLTMSLENEVAADSPLFGSLCDDQLLVTSGRLLSYVLRTQKRSLDHLQAVEMVELQNFLQMDYFSKRNLELTETIRSKGKKGSLLWLLDETQTAMGGRRLKEWVEHPLLSRDQIEKRHFLVETFMNHFFERENIRDMLGGVYDLERLVGRVAFGNCNARDLLQLKKSLQAVPAIKGQLMEMTSDVTTSIATEMDPCTPVSSLIEEAINENPPLSIREGEVIKTGYNADLDQYHSASKNGKNWIAKLEQDEKEKTGIRTLKVGYNRIFGYYIEITRTNIHLLNDDRYERKQTLANAERYITPELKEMEVIILEAEEKSVELEYQLFIKVRDEIKRHIPALQRLAKQISELDCIQCFAKVSEDRGFVRPELSDDREVVIKNGRHPVVEKMLKAQEYVPNDVELNDREREILLLTGPNMSGKSTYMRQVAHIVILNQIGCFVPAEKALLPIFDKVFTRIGAADDLMSGQSTFMVEMIEARNAMVHATRHSLLLFDEIGRGTSTYDGMALAQAIIEYIHAEIGALTLFSTHYHELTILEKSLCRLQNVHVRAVEQHGKVVFLHKVVEGPSDRSYGIHVAELAAMPPSLIVRAKLILEGLESSDTNVLLYPPEPVQLQLFPGEAGESELEMKPVAVVEDWLAKEISELAVLEMSPLDALNTLYALQAKLKNI